MKSILFFLIFSSLAYAQEEETEALRAMRLSCTKQKVALGCFNYANMLVRIDKSAEAEKFFETGCKLGHQGSCSQEKWDIPEKSAAPEPAEIDVEEITEAEPAVEEERPAPPTLSNGGAAPVESRITINNSPVSESSRDSSTERSQPSAPEPAPEAFPEAVPVAVPQSGESASPDIDLNSATPSMDAAKLPGVE